MHLQLLFTATFVLLLNSATAVASENSLSYTRFAGFELGKETLPQVQSKLGPSEIQKAGDAGEYEERLCYSVKSGTVTFLTGEIGAPKLAGLELSTKRGSSKCQPWPVAIPQPRMAISHIFLGMTRAHFERQLPSAKQLDDGRVSASYETKQPYTKNELAALSTEEHQQLATEKLQGHWDVEVSIVGSFERGRLSQVRIWKIKTN